MTLFFPDISSYESGLTIQPGTVAVIAKATEGTYYRDAQYANFKAQAATVGAVFSAYHFLKADGNPAGQADYCHAMVGPTPVMLDVETEGGSKPSVTDILAFAARMHELGGRVWGAYVPRWYWQQVGGNLALLGAAGMCLVSSNYTAYSDTGPGWAPYGGATPVIWQYTNAQPYGGQSVDFNAFRGTVEQLAALINGTTPTSTGGTVPAIPSSIGQKWPDIAGEFTGSYDDSTAIIWADAGARAAALYAREARDAVAALAAKVGQPVDVAALEAAIGSMMAGQLAHLTGNVDIPALASALAPALVAHLGIQVVAK